MIVRNNYFGALAIKVTGGKAKHRSEDHVELLVLDFFSFSFIAHANF